MPWSPRYYSEALELEYSVHSGGRVMTEDKVTYSPEEVRILHRQGGEIDKQIHNLKSIFRGELVEK